VGKAGGKFTIGARSRRFLLTELREQERQERQQRRRLQQMLERSLAKPPSKQPQRRQAKPTQDKILPKLHEKWPPHGKPPEDMSTSEVCRQIGVDPNSQWRSVNRALGREPKR
jgi:hypothetical protein